jgi:hypothetical protein
MARRKRTTLRTSHKLRVVDNDPDYERISDLRNARQYRFNAKITVYVGFAFLLPSSAFLRYGGAQFAFGAGLIIEAVAGLLLLSALSLEARHGR